MKKYKAEDWFRPEISEVEVIRETEKCVVTKNRGRERREQKESQRTKWCDTWEEAHAYLLARAEEHARQARLRLAEANGKLGNVKGMKPPDGGKLVENGLRENTQRESG